MSGFQRGEQVGADMLDTQSRGGSGCPERVEEVQLCGKGWEWVGGGQGTNILILQSGGLKDNVEGATNLSFCFTMSIS